MFLNDFCVLMDPHPSGGFLERSSDSTQNEFRAIDMYWWTESGEPVDMVDSGIETYYRGFSLSKLVRKFVLVTDDCIAVYKCVTVVQYYDNIPKDLVPGPHPPQYHVSMSNISVRINSISNTSNLHSIPFRPVFWNKSIANLLDFLPKIDNFLGSLVFPFKCDWL